MSAGCPKPQITRDQLQETRDHCRCLRQKGIACKELVPSQSLDGCKRFGAGLWGKPWSHPDEPPAKERRGSSRKVGIRRPPSELLISGKHHNGNPGQQTSDQTLEGAAERQDCYCITLLAGSKIKGRRNMASASLLSLIN